MKQIVIVELRQRDGVDAVIPGEPHIETIAAGKRINVGAVHRQKQLGIFRRAQRQTVVRPQQRGARI